MVAKSLQRGYAEGFWCNDQPVRIGNMTGGVRSHPSTRPPETHTPDSVRESRVATGGFDMSYNPTP